MNNDHLRIWSGYAFVVLLFLSAAMITLPDQDSPHSKLVDFYSLYGPLVIAMQFLGILAAALLIVFGIRFRQSDQKIGTALIISAVAGTFPAYPLIMLALLARSNIDDLTLLNRISALADNLLFIPIALVAILVAQKRAGFTRWVAVCVALFALLRSGFGFLQIASFVDTLAPLAFLALIVVLATQLLRAGPQIIRSR